MGSGDKSYQTPKNNSQNESAYQHEAHFLGKNLMLDLSDLFLLKLGPKIVQLLPVKGTGM